MTRPRPPAASGRVGRRGAAEAIAAPILPGDKQGLLGQQGDKPPAPTPAAEAANDAAAA